MATNRASTFRWARALALGAVVASAIVVAQPHPAAAAGSPGVSPGTSPVAALRPSIGPCGRRWA